MLEVMDRSKDYEQFIQRVKRKTNIDLSQYKEEQMKRRLNALRLRKGHQTFDEFFRDMMKDPALYEEFLDHMTINVTEFFRNPLRWKILREKIIPDLLARNGRIKCWSAACSTGEEPYSLAMLLTEFPALKDTQILATDLNQKVIDSAKAGIYRESTLKNLTPVQKSLFFSGTGNQCAISQHIKRKVTFKKQDLLSDPFDTRFDLIICRNVLIYFTDDAKDHLFKKFSQALSPGGYFFVGGSEQIYQPQKYGLTEVDTFFYKKL